ncbi:hypothetical protein K340107D12_55990 [Blautia parvula]|uniref:DNA-binding protein n=2 Tax=Blautia parvula TaxID=2877527 RepID=A0ABQ0C1W0_9FIRM
MMQEKMYMDVDDVCAILGVSKTYAYKLWNVSLSVGKYEHTGERKRYSYRHRTVLSEDVQGSKELL